MSGVAVRVEGLGKEYRLGARQPELTTFREVIVDAIGGPVRRVRQWFGNGSDGGADRMWALRDVSFEVAHGEVVGIIGRNGAGKSTLLKILSRITEPTAGMAEIEGRVGSLLEVGTGFHQELTGRENIYLNGAILGMRRRQIVARFDEIVQFAGIGPYIDTPVKHYSSGMYLRLAFAVAAHLEPDILIVDEVLAVGDAEFQRKCMAKMDSVAQGGRTVLFVSHSMNAIQRLCPRAILFDGGHLIADGPASDIVTRYLADASPNGSAGGPGCWIELKDVRRSGTGAVRFEAARYASDEPSIGYRPYSSGSLEFTLAITTDEPRRIGSVAVMLSDQLGMKLINADSVSLGRTVTLGAGRTLVSVRIDALHLKAGTFVVSLWLAEADGHPVYDLVEGAFEVEVVELQRPSLGAVPKHDGVVACDFVIQEAEAEPPRAFVGTGRRR